MPIVAVHFNMNDTLVASASIEGSIFVSGTSENNKTAASFTEPYVSLTTNLKIIERDLHEVFCSKVLYTCGWFRKWKDYNLGCSIGY
jgi:hypothetical protein